MINNRYFDLFIFNLETLNNKSPNFMKIFQEYNKHTNMIAYYDEKNKNKNLYIVNSYSKALEHIRNLEKKIDIILLMSNKSTIDIRNYIKNEKS